MLFNLIKEVATYLDSLTGIRGTLGVSSQSRRAISMSGLSCVISFIVLFSLNDMFL
jgi:hypothetical protein